MRKKAPNKLGVKSSTPNTLPVTNRGFLITEPSKITIQHIEKVCDLVEEGNFLDTAIGLAGIEPRYFYDLMSNCRQYPLGRAACHAIKQAEWKYEQESLTKIRDPQQFNAKILYDLMLITNPKLQARTRMQIKYENAVMLQAVLEVLGEEMFKKVLQRLVQNDPYHVVAELDHLLLHE